VGNNLVTDLLDGGLLKDFFSNSTSFYNDKGEVSFDRIINPAFRRDQAKNLKLQEKAAEFEQQAQIYNHVMGMFGDNPTLEQREQGIGKIRDELLQQGIGDHTYGQGDVAALRQQMVDRNAAREDLVARDLVSAPISKFVTAAGLREAAPKMAAQEHSGQVTRENTRYSGVVTRQNQRNQAKVTRDLENWKRRKALEWQEADDERKDAIEKQGMAAIAHHFAPGTMSGNLARIAMDMPLSPQRSAILDAASTGDALTGNLHEDEEKTALASLAESVTDPVARQVLSFAARSQNPKTRKSAIDQVITSYIKTPTATESANNAENLTAKWVVDNTRLKDVPPHLRKQWKILQGVDAGPQHGEIFTKSLAAPPKGATNARDPEKSSKFLQWAASADSPYRQDTKDVAARTLGSGDETAINKMAEGLQTTYAIRAEDKDGAGESDPLAGELALAEGILAEGFAKGPKKRLLEKLVEGGVATPALKRLNDNILTQGNDEETRNRLDGLLGDIAADRFNISTGEFESGSGVLPKEFKRRIASVRKAGDIAEMRDVYRAAREFLEPSPSAEDELPMFNNGAAALAFADDIINDTEVWGVMPIDEQRTLMSVVKQARSGNPKPLYAVLEKRVNKTPKGGPSTVVNVDATGGNRSTTAILSKLFEARQGTKRALASLDALKWFKSQPGAFTVQSGLRAWMDNQINRLGGEDPQEASRIRNAVVAISGFSLANYMRAQSGLTVSDREAARLQRSWPDADNDGAERFFQKVAAAEAFLHNDLRAQNELRRYTQKGAKKQAAALNQSRKRRLKALGDELRAIEDRYPNTDNNAPLTPEEIAEARAYGIPVGQ